MAFQDQYSPGISKIDFVSLVRFHIGSLIQGMFIIDEIYRDDGVQLGNDLPGGAGTYALIGARFFNPPPESKRLSMIIDMGNDFPANTLASIQRLQCSILLRQTPDRRTTRGYNLY